MKRNLSGARDIKQHLSLFRIRFVNGLQYRAAAIGGLTTQFFWGSMQLLLYRAFYRSGGADFPMEFHQLSSYIWLQQAFLTLFMLWHMDTEALQSIASGNVAYELARPIDLYSMWFTKNLAVRLSRSALRCVPILLFAALLPYPYGFALPPDLPTFVVFIVTLALAFFSAVAFCMLIYIATFYTLSPVGVRIFASALNEFLSGAIIPLPFMPDGIRRIIELTPFATLQNLPFRIYSGNIAGTEMLRGIMLQVFWLMTLVLISRLWMSKTLKKVVIQGG